MDHLSKIFDFSFFFRKSLMDAPNPDHPIPPVPYYFNTAIDNIVFLERVLEATVPSQGTSHAAMRYMRYEVYQTFCEDIRKKQDR